MNLLGLQAKFAPVELSEAELVALSHQIAGVRYLQSSKLLTMPSPTSSVGEPLIDKDLIDWLWKIFQIVFQKG